MTLRGIWSAAITPVDQTFEPDVSRAIPFYRDLLANGCDGINLLGTTGQAMSFAVTARAYLMGAVAESGLPMARFMCGTGAASVHDAVELTRAAGDARFAAALVMPPFFYRDCGDEGIMRYFDTLINATGIDLILYNFPRMSGYTFHPDLVTRLLEGFPKRIVGIKDSSNDAPYQREVIARHPELSVFPGSEENLIDVLGYGGAGCISASVTLWAPLAQEVFTKRSPADGKRLNANRAELGGAPIIPQIHARIAAERKDDAWKRVVPPLMPAS